MKFCVCLALIPLAFSSLFALRYLVMLRANDLLVVLLCALAALWTFLCGCILDVLRLHSRR